MRKLCAVLVVFSMLFICGQAGASIVQIFAVDDLAIDVYGFGADILAPDGSVVGDFTLTKGALPSAMWDAWIAGTPNLGVQAVDYFANAPLVGGLLVTLESTLDFDLDIDSFIVAGLGGVAYSGDLFDIVPGLIDDTIITYTISNPVPIPPALLLFGSGIIGMLGLRRKFNK